MSIRSLLPEFIAPMKVANLFPRHRVELCRTAVFDTVRHDM